MTLPDPIWTAEEIEQLRTLPPNEREAAKQILLSRLTIALALG